MKKNTISNIFFRPTLFVESANINEIPFIFAVLVVAVNFIFGFVVYEVLGFAVVVPESLIDRNFEIVINVICDLIVFPLLIVFFLRNVKKHILKTIFIVFYSVYVIEILMNFFIFTLGILNLLNSNIFIALVIPFSIWQLSLLFLAVHVLSSLSKAKSLWVFLKALFVSVLLCGIIIDGPRAWEAWHNVMQKETHTVSNPYRVKESEGKLLSYNMNSLGLNPEPIRCITKDKGFVNVFLEIKFRLINNKLKEMYKRFEKIKGYYEPEMELQISDVVKTTVRNNYAVEEVLYLKTDEFKIDINRKIKHQLSSIGIELIDLKIIKVEKIEVESLKEDKKSKDNDKDMGSHLDIGHDDSNNKWNSRGRGQ